MGQRYAETQAQHPDLIAPIRAALKATGLPYVIENVMGARRELDHPIQLCGRAFGLGVGRHRLFECSFACMSVQCACTGSSFRCTASSTAGASGPARTAPSSGRRRRSSRRRLAMGIDWMTWDDLREAIPPAYTEHIGGYLMRAIQTEAAA
jgi:DNA (cytosine-5)-methyltransferase 1